MKLSPGFKFSGPTKLCYLRKSLYDLKQTPRGQFDKLAGALKDFGNVQSYADYSMLTYIKGEKSLRVLIMLTI